MIMISKWLAIFLLFLGTILLSLFFFLSFMCWIVKAHNYLSAILYLYGPSIFWGPSQIYEH